MNGDELERALRDHDRRSLGEVSTISFANLDVRPYPHQQRMLEQLTSNANGMIVIATSWSPRQAPVRRWLPGWTIASWSTGPGGPVAAVRRTPRGDPRQSLATYRAVLRDGNFGEIHGGGRVADGRHVFAMIQSLREQRLEQIADDTFDVVVVDEFHHAAATTYDRLLNHLSPVELLGLTATPERLDGQDVTTGSAAGSPSSCGCGRPSIRDSSCRSSTSGSPTAPTSARSGGDVAATSPRSSSNLLTNDDLRVAKLLEAMQRIVFDLGTMRALGFCVSIEHARYMARKFTDAGLESVALTGEDPPDVRSATLARLRSGDLRCIFSVEVLGEGIDVPDVDCLLLLRPTSSATLFSQQLGRGLRRAKGKSHLTVVDMIGQHRREFRFEDRLRAILDPRRGRVLQQVEADFPFLPAGCTIDLDRQSRELDPRQPA